MLIRWFGCLTLLLGTLQACGGRATEQERSSNPRGDSPEDTSSSGDLPNSSSGGTGTAGTSQGAETSGSGGTGQTGGTGGSLSHPLITGDPACPTEGPLSSACAVPDAVCVYRGLALASYPIPEAPMRCTCVSKGYWSCVSSDEQGNSPCVASPPGSGKACKVGDSCGQVINWVMGSCSCGCEADEALGTGGAQGGEPAGGAGGESSGAGGLGTPQGRWQCAC